LRAFFDRVAAVFVSRVAQCALSPESSSIGCVVSAIAIRPVRLSPSLLLVPLNSNRSLLAL